MKFTTPVSMLVGKEQFEKLSDELYKLGYILSSQHTAWPGENLLVTNVAGKEGFGLAVSFGREKFNRYYIDHYNPELFLALAAMNDSEHGIKGEYWICIQSAVACGEGVGDMIKADGKIYPGKWRKATKEEIIARFTTQPYLGLHKMVEEFVLPEKWAVKRTLQNYKVINEWARKRGTYLIDAQFYIHVSGKEHPFINTVLCTGYTEITYEQFLQYVLKQQEFITKGNYVVCIDNKGTPGLLTIGSEYLVKHIDSAGIWVIDDTGIETQFLRNRFILKQSSMENVSVGDVVVCIDNDHQKQSLTLGREYKILGVDKKEVKMINNYNTTGWYNKTRFELVKQQSMEKKFKVGGKARFVSGNLVGFTIGKEYYISHIDIQECLYLEDDGGRLASRMPQHFEPVEERKIVGYKLKNNNYLAAAMSLTGTTMYREQFIKYLANQEKENSNGAYVGMLREAGVLDLWFEKIYEEEKPKTRELTLGNNNVKVTVHQDGEIRAVSRGFTYPFKVDQLSRIYCSMVNSQQSYKLGNQEVVYKQDSHYRSIRIGCSSENNMFSMGELKAVIDAYNELNK